MHSPTIISLHTSILISFAHVWLWPLGHYFDVTWYNDLSSHHDRVLFKVFIWVMSGLNSHWRRWLILILVFLWFLVFATILLTIPKHIPKEKIYLINKGNALCEHDKETRSYYWHTQKNTRIGSHILYTLLFPCSSTSFPCIAFNRRVLQYVCCQFVPLWDHATITTGLALLVDLAFANRLQIQYIHTVVNVVINQSSENFLTKRHLEWNNKWY